ncbi:cupin domain-containing protein [Kocuria sp. M1N1S27]|uniref:cupin domain-containing protein n=1 Tax=Kocuria kalidii TaxID=3376283 RepID=UPI00378D2D92
MSEELFPAPRRPRRVVTAVKDGRSGVVSDGPIPNALHHQATPGMMSSIVYRTASQPQLTDGTEETAPERGPLVPAPGGTTLLFVKFPPDSVYQLPGFDPVASAEESAGFAPDFAATFEPDSPGFHNTSTIDYDIVVDGEIWLELDEETVHLVDGDVAIQHGTRHAWRNKGDRPATMAFVLIGPAVD